jgi:hypothetical protein
MYGWRQEEVVMWEEEERGKSERFQKSDLVEHYFGG